MSNPLDSPDTYRRHCEEQVFKMPPDTWTFAELVQYHDHLRTAERVWCFYAEELEELVRNPQLFTTIERQKAWARALERAGVEQFKPAGPPVGGHLAKPAK